MCAGSTEKQFLFAVFCLFYPRPDSVHRPDCLYQSKGFWIESPDTNLSTAASKGGIFSCHGAFSENVITVIQDFSCARNRSAEGTFFLLFYSDIFKRVKKTHKETQMCSCLYAGFSNPLEAELDALSVCLSLFQSRSVTEIARDFRSWWV